MGLNLSGGAIAGSGAALCALFLLSNLSVASARAPEQDGGWSAPYRLSSDDGRASEGHCIPDPYSFVHCFWSEILYADSQSVIRYARFDGATWTASNEIHVTGAGIENLSVDLDADAALRLAWTESLNGPAYTMHAPAHNALSSQIWSLPRRIDIPTGMIRILVDSSGVQHILYVNRGKELGVYYTRSEDGGLSWTDPFWLDPDIPSNHTPESLNFELDEAGGLHAVWKYGALDANATSRDAVRYIHSLDGGEIWSPPFTIDQPVEESNHRLTFAEPRMVVQGKTVHVVWAAGELPYRYHRFSTDSGQTWSLGRRIFGDLHGQAFDGLTVDGAGSVHYLGQIRYPMGIYHGVWKQGEWSVPSLIYLISDEGSEGGIGDYIHAHHVQPVVRAGNQLVVPFADDPVDPNRRLFVMHRTLGNIATLAPLPTPTPDPTAPPTPTQTLDAPTPTPAPLVMAMTGSPSESGPEPGAALRAALPPALLLIGGSVAIRLLHSFNR